MSWYKKAQFEITMGININDSECPWSEWIVDGKKTVETRNTDSLRPYVGKRVGIVQTGKGKAKLIGEATIGEPKVYENPLEFRIDYNSHWVAPRSEFDMPKGGVKFGYPIIDPIRYKSPVEVESRGIIARFIGDIVVAKSSAN